MPIERRRIILASAALAVVALLFFYFVPPIAQEQRYHVFADARTLLGIPNFWNVVSNLGFAIAGLAGLGKLRGATARVLFAGVLLTCFGSAYYHWAPDDSRLLWDRLPMTLVFMAFLAAIVGEGWTRCSRLWLLALLLSCGAASVAWWRITGDLRPYALVQFGPILILLPALWFHRERETLWAIFASYILAKAAEHFDAAVFSYFPFSGHTLKHLLGALSAWCIYRLLLRAQAPSPRALPDILLPMPSVGESIYPAV